MTSLHRQSFAPIAKLLDAGTVHPELAAKGSLLTSKARGDIAEQSVAEYLESNGYVIVERNWKTKYCEIDIIAKKEKTVYFVEVKYRSSTKQGGGVAAVTAKKLQQMNFAAELYMQRNPLQCNGLLMVASVDSTQGVELLEVS